MTSDPGPLYQLEPPVPLAQSLVWRLQRTFYGDQGIAAWGPGRVPQWVTTSPIIAGAYANVVHGFLRDFASDLDPSEPVYIVELGAGSGRFAYRFLKALSAKQRFVYVMTDASPTVVEFWRDNPRLRQFVEAGVLDFALFDLVQLGPLELVTSGRKLADGLINPVVVIGNYIFDSVPQDAYTVRDGQLFRGLLSVSASTPDLDLRADDARVRVSIAYSSEPQPMELDAEGDLAIRAILQVYCDRLGDTTLLIPRAAMACVRHFEEMAGHRALCLIGDMGDTREEELRDHGPPGFGAGGGFWLAVNFHALGEYARLLGGRPRHPVHRSIVLNISALLFGPPAADFAETEAAFSTSIDQHGPDDLTIIARAVGEHLENMNLEQILALLRTSGWDSTFVYRSVSRLLDLLPDANPRLRAEVLDGLHQTSEQYFPIGEPDDLPFALGVLLYAIEQYSEALGFFQLSLDNFGQDPRTTLNLALTYYRLDRLAESLVWLDRTLELDPSNEIASNMRPDVAGDLANRN